MSNVQTRMERSAAIAIAKAFVAELEGTYTQLIVAGSLRRRLAYVHDIEVIAVPKVETMPIGFPDMFGEQAMGDVDLLSARMSEMLDAGETETRLDVNGSPRFGPKLKYLTYQGANVDLFTPEAGNFGWHLMLRTGPAPFSRQLVVPRSPVPGDERKPTVTKDRRRGLLPPHIKPVDGWLTFRTSGERIETPTEASVFELFGMPWREPWERT